MFSYRHRNIVMINHVKPELNVKPLHTPPPTPPKNNSTRNDHFPVAVVQRSRQSNFHSRTKYNNAPTLKSTLVFMFIHNVNRTFKTCFIWVAPCETRLWTYADSEGPDQPAHPRSLIRAFTVRLQTHCILYRMHNILRANARMILCACVG